MYSQIKPFYKEQNIFQRNEQYYSQLLDNSQRRNLEPSNPYNFLGVNSNAFPKNMQNHIPVPTKISLASDASQRSVFQSSSIGQPLQSNISANTYRDTFGIRQPIQQSHQRSRSPQSFSPVPRPNQQNSIEIDHIGQITNKVNANKIQRSRSKSNSQVSHNVSERQILINQHKKLRKQLDFATMGVPYDEEGINQESQLLSNSYVLPKYREQEGSSKLSHSNDSLQTIREQEKEIKALTQKIISNQKKISSMKDIQKGLAERVDRIRSIDTQIYARLDEERAKQVQSLLNEAKNGLAKGDSQDKIASILKKILC